VSLLPPPVSLLPAPMGLLLPLAGALTWATAGGVRVVMPGGRNVDRFAGVNPRALPFGVIVTRVVLASSFVCTLPLHIPLQCAGPTGVHVSW